MALIEIDGLPVYLLIAWWIFPWRTVSHNQMVEFFFNDLWTSTGRVVRQLRSVERRKFGNPWSGNARIGEAQLEIFKEILLSWRFPKIRVTQIISNHPLFFDHFSIETILIPQLDPPSCYLKGGNPDQAMQAGTLEGWNAWYSCHDIL